jgi:FAD:protein FMN transferase
VFGKIKRTQQPPFGAVFVGAAIEILMLRTSKIVLQALIAIVVSACDERNSFQLSGATQGTTYHITVVAEQRSADATLLQKKIEGRLSEIDHALSNYNADSDLSRFNRAPVDEWFALSPDLHRVLKTSQAISIDSDGAFDITIAPLVELWGFGAFKSERIPAAAEIIEAKRLVDFRNLELDADVARARKKSELRIDVNGIAQGYTVDRLAELLSAQGYRNFLIEVGGELRLVGHNARAEPWRIGIEKPADGFGAVEQAMRGSNIGITTAGDYHDYFERNGQRYSHTIDPATGRPITHRLASVTVIAASAEYADGIDTVLEVLGPERGYRFAEQRHIAAYFIMRTDEGFVVRYTPEFARYLQ